MIRLQTHQLTISIANQTVCDKLDLCIESGQVWGLLGRNGAGKTTLLHALAGIREPDSGTIILNEKPLADLSRRQVAQQLGILLQQHEDSFPSSVIETVLSGRHPHIDRWSWEDENDQDKAAQALAEVELSDKAQRCLDQLSGGERQRVAIATLITQSPDIFLLDEPSTHLDLVYQIKLLNYFREQTIAHDKSVLMSLHDINLANQYCTHLLMLLDNGEVLTGTVAELLNTGTLELLYNVPFTRLQGENGDFFSPVTS